VAHYPPVPQERISSQIREVPQVVDELAI